jgi:hypothetical protein
VSSFKSIHSCPIWWQFSFVFHLFVSFLSDFKQPEFRRVEEPVEEPVEVEIQSEDVMTTDELKDLDADLATRPFDFEDGEDQDDQGGLLVDLGQRETLTALFEDDWAEEDEHGIRHPVEDDDSDAELELEEIRRDEMQQDAANADPKRR